MSSSEEDIGGADAAIGADGEGTCADIAGNAVDVPRMQAHHRLAGRVERAGIDAKGRPTLVAASAAARISSGEDMVSIQAISAAGLQALDLLGEGGDGIVIGHRAERHEQFARRADGAGDDHRARRLVGDRAGNLGCLPVEVEDAVLRMVQLQAMARPEGNAAGRRHQGG